MKVTVLGSGNGACATAADWSINGHDVSIFDFESFKNNLKVIEAQGGIYVIGAIEGFAKLSYVGSDINKAIEGAEVIIPVGPSYSSEPFAHAIKQHIKNSQLYILSPGSYGGALVTKKIFETVDNAKNVVIAEASTLPYAARIFKPGTVKVHHKLIGGLLLAAIPYCKTEQALCIFKQVYPYTLAGTSIFHTMLQNANPVIHPTVTLMNAALIERTQGNFLFYEEGVTTAVGRVMEAIDMERIKIGEKLRVDIIPDPEIGVLQGYMTEANYSTGYSKAPGFKGVSAQKELDHRYLHEDAGYGLVFLSELAKSVGVKTPMIDAVIQMASIAVGRDYRRESVRTLAGIGYSVEEVQNL